MRVLAFKCLASEAKMNFSKIIRKVIFKSNSKHKYLQNYLMIFVRKRLTEKLLLFKNGCSLSSVCNLTFPIETPTSIISF